MSNHAYTEDQLVEQPAIGLFAELGWTTVSALEEIFGSAEPSPVPSGHPLPVGVSCWVFVIEKSIHRATLFLPPGSQGSNSRLTLKPSVISSKSSGLNAVLNIAK